MARHKPSPKPEIECPLCEGKGKIEEGAPPDPPSDDGGWNDATRANLARRESLAERVLEAKAKLEAAETVAMSCYWQGAVDALEAYSRGIAHESTAIGAGVPK